MSRLLSLPQEIKDKIWELAFANHELQLYTTTLYEGEPRFNELEYCEFCASLFIRRYTYQGSDPEYVVRMIERRLPPLTPYNRMLNSILTCRDMATEALTLFQSTLTIQLKSPEAIAWFRHSAPPSLRKTVQNVIICVHFDHSNHALWCSRIMEIPKAFPALKRLMIRYHMRPPISYDNLLDALYLSVAIQSLPNPFRVPCKMEKAGKADPLPTLPLGTTIETAYTEEQALFEADWLGSVTTADAIDEHTALVRDLFYESGYVEDVQRLLRLNSSHLEHCVRQAYLPDRYPSGVLSESFQIVSSAADLQQSLLLIARRHEKPWFEKLMRRRIVQVWEQTYGANRHGEVQAFLATLPEGGGVEEIIQALAQNHEMAVMFHLD